ncbi:ABC transporter ATP-binding protein [Nocardiopsis protaetiae]|uniref:ABC transporter ATP-binding protein n=1 Tax=Nocardiopsis protaetiae TaxID=3382270 RepID=UPI00387B284E
MTGTTETVLAVEGLTVIGRPSDVTIVGDVSLTVRRGEILGLVGESGSGKTTVGLALLAHRKRATEITGGRVEVAGRDLASLDERGVRALRGRAVAYIPQSPASALNPALRLRVQLREALHDGDLSPAEADARVREVLREVALPDDDVFLRRYPHQLSGGQQQRVAIAMAFVGRPDVIVMDEPTTGLDVTTQKHVLDTVRRMTREYGTAGIYISHDMAVVAELADAVAVMYRGELVEHGPTGDVLSAPRHEYTRALLAAVPRMRTDAPEAERGGELLRVSGLSAGYGRTRVLEDIDLSVARGECTALVGESGSGKTTLSRTVAGLHRGAVGEVLFDGAPLPLSGRRRTAEQRRRIQYIFQNPYEALNPRKRVRELILGPYRHLAGRPGDPDRVVTEALERAALPASYADRFPEQLSGGERQRVCIARAVATGPDLLVCDEVTSALDVSVQAEIVSLLRGLQDEGMALLFVTHNIALVSNIAQQVAVLERGRIVEYGPVGRVMSEPRHEYTRALLADTPDFAPEAGAAAE